MKEFKFNLHQRTGRAPVIEKLGAIKPGMEQTPLVIGNDLYIVESMSPDSTCDCQYIRIRNTVTGEISKPFGKNYYFASAFEENGTVYVFASSTRDDKALTMYTAGMDSNEWHDPRGGHTIRMFSSSDFTHWDEKDIITCPEKRFWNTSVCRGDGVYMMAIEVSAEDGFETEAIGVPFTCFFAKSTDLQSWEMLPDEYSYTYKRYNACPVLRYFDGYYYMICLEAFPCLRYAPYIYRTRDFFNWEVGFHNPIMMWGDDDRRVKEGCHLTPEQLDLLENGLNINCSDIDLCEYNGETHIYYANGDQMTYSFLCEAVYHGPLQEFLEAFFK